MSDKPNASVSTRFNSKTGSIAGKKSGEVRRQIRHENDRIRAAWSEQADNILKDFTDNKPIFGCKITQESRMRILEQYIVNAMIQKNAMALKYQHEADLMQLRSEIKADEDETERGDDNRTGLTPVDIMNLCGTQSEAMSRNKADVIVIEKHKVSDVTDVVIQQDKKEQTFGEWYNSLPAEKAGPIVEHFFYGSQSDFLACFDMPATEVINMRGINLE